MDETLLLISAFLLAFCLVANRLAKTVLTAPMAFLGFGVAVASLGVLPLEELDDVLDVVAEIALVVLLFLDAAKTDQRALIKTNVWPFRMLLIGLPVAFAIGLAFNLLLLPGVPLVLAALIAAILTPTDAALGQPVVANQNVPERARRALTVESGLNDGLALPLVLLTASLAAPAALAPDEGWALFGLKQITFAPVVGIVFGWIGGTMLLRAQNKELTTDVYEGIAALALAASAYLGATIVGGNGFIATFFAGLGFGAVVKDQCKFVFEFSESEGQLLSWAAFFLLGAALVPEAIASLTVPMLLVILVSLFCVRPLAIWISLIGTDADLQTRLFFGWFGPRGLATALFALLVFEQFETETADFVLHLAVNAVWISALLHGVTAAPGAKLFARLSR